MKKSKFIPFVNANAAPLTGGKWEKIASYGDHPSRDRKSVQRFGRDQAETMVTTFNSFAHKLGTLFRGVPIYHGHPDVLPKEFTDDRRLGKIVELEAREDGLYGVPEFNSVGRENKEEGWWPFPSPAWLSPPAKGGVVYPDELLSIGLVANPNLSDALPWTNSAEGEEEEQETITDNDMKLTPEALKALGLSPDATPTDAELSAAIIKLSSDRDTALANATTAATAKDDAVKDKETAATAFANSRASFATVLFDAGVTLGNITEAERVATVNSLSKDGADIATLAKPLLEKKVASLNTASLDLGGRKVSISTARERTAAIQAEVNSRMTGQGMTYDAAYASVKADPKFKPLFEAQKQPGQKAD